MYKFLLVLISSLLVIAILSCAPAIKAGYDYDTKEDFSRYKTFDYLTFPENTQMNIFVLKRTKSLLTRELISKGLQQSSEKPDLLIAIHTRVRSRVQVGNLGYAYAPQVVYWSSYGYFGSYGWQVREYQKGTLVVDFVDAREKEMVWRGVAEGSLPDIPQTEKIEKIVNQAVKEMMKYYPPPPRKEDE
jgi:hypothetical protein